jgi:hypothetical protein
MAGSLMCPPGTAGPTGNTPCNGNCCGPGIPCVMDPYTKQYGCCSATCEAGCCTTDEACVSNLDVNQTEVCCASAVSLRLDASILSPLCETFLSAPTSSSNALGLHRSSPISRFLKSVRVLACASGVVLHEPQTARSTPWCALDRDPCNYLVINSPLSGRAAPPIAGPAGASAYCGGQCCSSGSACSSDPASGNLQCCATRRPLA